MPPPAPSTGVTITNPLVLYRALIATKRIDPDPAQHRLAIHLQKLYEQLKDYEPIVQYKHRLEQISKALGSTTPRNDDSATIQTQSTGLLKTLFDRSINKDSLALTRVLTNHEQVLQLDSPRGLMLHGEVGTGKSMLIDLFADCLPNRKKRRWHFTTFMLETFAKLEHLRRSRQAVIPSSLGQQDDYSLLWLAREMISTSPILFLDEFQLPDRAASKIITNLMTSFFHMGGVLIATSNRMPEELAKAAGVEFTPPPSRLESLGWKFGLSSPGLRRNSGAMSSGSGDFAAFLEVLKARCEVWQMENGKDYRRREAEIDVKEAVGEDAAHHLSTQGFEGLEEMSPGNVGLGYEQSRGVEQSQEEKTSALPKNYFVRPSSSDPAAGTEAFQNSFTSAQNIAVGHDSALSSIPWETGVMRVYGRNVLVPRQCNGVSSWTFLELCTSTLGPADYITLASTYHTLILTDVPVLSLLQKNEARRFITLLDALYEARCKLILTADAGPDDIFFPETQKPAPNSSASQESEETISQDAILSETVSEVYQDATAPFRPNISTYETSSLFAPSEPDYTHSRLAGIFSDDQLEDAPPNAPRHRDSHANGMGRGDSIHGLDTAVDPRRRGPDFSQAGVFTGEDEKFAYKRARSRLWEMCGTRWWLREEEGWWKPLERSVRAWEGPELAPAGVGASATAAESGVAGTGVARAEVMGESRDVDEKQDEVLFRHGASPFRTHGRPPPKFQWTHFWGMMTWGKKAGAWGRGVEGLDEAKEERTKRKEDGKAE